MNGKTGNEIDSLRQINKKKAGNTDAITPPPTEQEIQPPQIAGIGGSDNNEPVPTIPGSISLSPEKLQALVDAKVDAALRQNQEKVDTAKRELEAKDEELEKIKRDAEQAQDALKAQMEAERKQNDFLTSIFGNNGYPMPTTGDSSTAYIAPISSRGQISGRDAVKEFERILNDKHATPTITVKNRSSGELITQRDTSNLTKFIREHKESMRAGMDSLLQKNGFLQGPYTSTDAATTPTTLPFVILTYLSSVIRLEHSSQFVLWQFSSREISTGVPPSQTTDVARIKHIASGTASSDWRLTPGTDIDTSNTQALTGSSAKVTILENGMGKTGGLIPLVSIPDFVLSASIIDLELILQERIGYNYNLFEDVTHQEIYFSTTRAVYNNKGSVAEDPADLNVGSGGQTTVAFLGSLRAHLGGSAKVEPLEDGCYIYAAPMYQIAQLNSDMDQRRRYFEASNIEDLTNILFRTTRNKDLGRVMGYVGKFSGFHIFETNSFGCGIAGTTGVQMETITGSSKLTRSGLAMGVGAAGWATSLPMQIRKDDNTNLQRNNKFGWISHEGFGALDVDPDIDPPNTSDQQLRVFEVRTLDVEI